MSSEYEPGPNTAAYHKVVEEILTRVDLAHLRSDQTNSRQSIFYDEVADRHGIFSRLTHTDKKLSLRTYEYLDYAPLSEAEQARRDQQIRLVATAAAGDSVHYAVITQNRTTFQGQAPRRLSDNDQDLAIAERPNPVEFCRNNLDFVSGPGCFSIEDTAQFIGGMLMQIVPAKGVGAPDIEA